MNIIIDERQMQKKKKTKAKKDRKEQWGTEAIVKEWELNDFIGQLS